VTRHTPVMNEKRTLPWILINMGIATGLLLAFFLLGPGIDRVDEDGSSYIFIGAALAFVFMGSLVMTRVPGHRVGWVLTANGMLLIASGLAQSIADTGHVFAGAIGGAMWLGWFITVGFLILWFPTGRVPSPRWRWVEWIGWLVVAFVAVTYTFAERLCAQGADNQCEVWVDNPIGIPGVPNPEYSSVSTAGFMIMVVFLALAAGSLVVRLFKAKGVERQQLKWLTLVAVLFVVWLLLPEESMSVMVNNTVLGFAVIGLPVATALAVLRYRLYDIDRIVSRTVTYAVVVGVLAAGYAGAVTWVSSLLPDQSQLAVAGSTLAVAALFNPLRRLVQNWVDRRFNRSRYDTQRVMDEFTESLRERVDGQDVVGGWVAVVSETMKPSFLGVWLRAGS
jgi:hypothetical protein